MQYKITEQLLSSIMQVLNEIPAKHSRPLLNRIDGEIAPQIQKKKDEQDKTKEVKPE